MSGNILIATIMGGGVATGVCWGEIRDAAKYFIVCRKPPHTQKRINYPTQNVSSAEVKKPCCALY